MRSARLDNIKAVLIFLVVYGHFLELCSDMLSKGIYLIIYSFHMPAFVFCSGLVAKYSPKKTAAGILYPYLVFQTVYLLVFGEKFTYLTPYWLLWYMMSLFVWKMSLGFLNSKKRVTAAFFISLVLCGAAGFVKSIGPFLCLSKIICYYPFFLAGVLFGRYKERKILRFAKKYRALLCVLSLVSILAILYFAANGTLQNNSFYYKTPYRNLTDFFFRIQLVMTAFCLMPLLLLRAKNKKYFFTYMGKNTLAVYLLHGFIVKFTRRIAAFNEPLVPLAAAAAVTVLLASGTVQKLIGPFVSPPFMNFRKTRG